MILLAIEGRRQAQLTAQRQALSLAWHTAALTRIPLPSRRGQRDPFPALADLLEGKAKARGPTRPQSTGQVVHVMDRWVAATKHLAEPPAKKGRSNGRKDTRRLPARRSGAR